MSISVDFLREALIAEVAAIGPQLEVRSQMLKQRLIFLEELSADVTAQHIVLAPRAHVLHLLFDVVP